MTRDDIIRMAREAGMDPMVGTIRDGKYVPKVNALKHSVPVEWLESFAELVAADAVAAEREAISKMVDYEDDGMPGNPMYRLGFAIRKRGAA